VIPAGKTGTYLAVVNTGFASKKDVTLNIPKCSKLLDAVTGAELKMIDGKLTVSMFPGELRTLCGK
jgi:hypothetical protein